MLDAIAAVKMRAAVEIGDGPEREALRLRAATLASRIACYGTARFRCGCTL